MVSRTEIIQTFINRKGYRRYLEVGVSRGDNFLLVRAAHKTAVDPCFQVPWVRWARTVVRHPDELRSRYFENTSDEYFEQEAERLSRHGVQVAFIDGDHTYEQCYRDILNALRYLPRDGVILVHDCSPPSANAAATWDEFNQTRGKPGWTPEWCGDVWRAIARLRVERPDLGALVLDCDYGVGVVTPFPLELDTTRPPFSLTQIEAMSYADFTKDRTRLIGLRPASDLETIVALVCARRDEHTEASGSLRPQGR